MKKLDNLDFQDRSDEEEQRSSNISKNDFVSIPLYEVDSTHGELSSFETENLVAKSGLFLNCLFFVRYRH